MSNRFLVTNAAANRASPFRGAFRQLLEQADVAVLDLRRMVSPSGGRVAARVAVSASDPSPEVGSYHVWIDRTPDGALYVWCSCRSASPCTHSVAALISCGFASLLGISPVAASLVFAPTARVNGQPLPVDGGGRVAFAS